MMPNKSLKLPLAVAEVDRAAHLRSDEAYLKSAWASASVLLFMDEKFVASNNQISFVSGSSLGEYQSQTDYFLGVKDKDNFFVRHLESDENTNLELKSLRESITQELMGQ